METKQLYSTSRTRLSLIALILANLVPVIGVLFFDWDHTLVIALFWIENLIIGAFNVLKMCAVMIVRKSWAVFIPCFFIFHYGLFCAAHGAILWDILELGELHPPESLFGVEIGGIFSLFADGAGVLLGFIELHSPIILLGIISLLLSRLVSFIENFLLKGRIFEANEKDLMGEPYGQILVMHVGVILGAMAIEKFGSSVWLLLIIVMFKIFIDAQSHAKRHSRARNLA